jgi:hypothetical protein
MDINASMGNQKPSRTSKQRKEKKKTNKGTNNDLYNATQK